MSGVRRRQRYNGVLGSASTAEIGARKPGTAKDYYIKDQMFPFVLEEVRDKYSHCVPPSCLIPFVTPGFLLDSITLFYAAIPDSRRQYQRRYTCWNLTLICLLVLHILHNHARLNSIGLRY